MKTDLQIIKIAETNYVKNLDGEYNLADLENPNERFNYDGGLSAGICYMSDDFKSLANKPIEKTLARAEMTKSGGHHSVFEHDYVSFIFVNIPKLLAMTLNNEKCYVTSEKSARYTVMELVSPQERLLYEKWKEIFNKEITKKYGSEKYFDAKRINKLAMENARYMLSVYTPTIMRHTLSYRQINYLYHWFKKQNGVIATNPCFEPILDYIDDFCEQLENLNLIDEKLANDQKDRDFSLIGRRVRGEEFGENYSINYDGTFAQFAQAQRHRTLNYEFRFKETASFYTPKIIIGNKALEDMWLEDIMKVQHILPQGMQVAINERGTYENLILKAKERLCTAAQLEINNQTKATLDRYLKECKFDAVKKELETYTHGARCTFPDFKCPTPCGFKEGVNLTRDI